MIPLLKAIKINKMDISEVTFDNIETNLMSILYANINTEYTHTLLFNKLIQDKYDDVTYVPQIFKTKFLLVLSNLSGKYDDLTIEKNDNIITIICNSDEKTENKENNSVNTEKVLEREKKHELNELDTLKMYEYIFNNNMDDYINKIDEFTGNTIYHELVKENNISLIENLVKKNAFNYYVKNNDNKKPFELSKSKEVTNILMGGLFEEIKRSREEINIVNYECNEKIIKLDKKIMAMKKVNFRHCLIFIAIIVIAIFLNIFTKVNKH